MIILTQKVVILTKKKKKNCIYKQKNNDNSNEILQVPLLRDHGNNSKKVDKSFRALQDGSTLPMGDLVVV